MAEKKKNDSALRIKNVSKSFDLPHQKADSIKSIFVNPFQRYTNEKQKALNGISLDIKKGEFFGIVGRNGSGKSTLLKCIAGVYGVDEGEIIRNGSLVPFIELGVGFNSDLSGRDNVYLNGAMLGFSREQMDDMYNEIVEFAELEKFMDQKLKNYSSGMQVRLAFSIAIRAESDILLLDEVLAVGDSAFKQKCNNYFYDLKNSGKTIILVTHSMSAVEEYCTRAMLMDKGEVLSVGKPDEITDLYNELNFRSTNSPVDQKNKSLKQQMLASSKEVKPDKAEIVHIETFNPKTNKVQSTFKYDEQIGVRYKIEARSDIESPTVGLVFRDRLKNRVFATNTQVKKTKLKDMKSGDKATVEFVVDNIFDNTSYMISGAVASTDRSEVFHRVKDAYEFSVFGWKMMNSMVNPPHQIKIK